MSGVCLGYVWGVSGVCLRCVWGVSGGVSGVCRGVCLGCVWGVSGCVSGCVWGVSGVCLEPFLCAVDTNVIAVLQLPLRVTNVKSSDFSVVVDNGRSRLWVLLNSIFITAAARWWGEHRVVGTAWQWNASHSSTKLHIALRRWRNDYRTIATSRIYNARGRSRNWAAIWHTAAAATKICCSRKSNWTIEIVLSGETSPTVDVTKIGDCKLHTLSYRKCLWMYNPVIKKS